MRYNTGNPVGPDGSSDPRDLCDTAGVADLFAHGMEVSFPDRLNVQRKSIRGMEVDFFNLMQTTGWETAFIQYAGGAIVQRATQLVQYPANTGELYRVKNQGDLPLTLTGTWSTDAPKLIAIGDAALRSGLAEVDSTVSIAGVPAWELALLNKADDYTIIRPSLRRISTSLCDIAISLSGVITGDSLSISAFGYPTGWPALGGGYATENPFGLSSWPHLIRDLCLTVSPAFVPIEEVNVSTDATKSYADTAFYKYAINQKVVNFYFSTTSKKMILQNTYTGAKCLIVSYVPTAEACLFEVDGVEYSNASPDGHYQSNGYMFVPHSGEYATVTNVRYASGATGGNLWFYGVGDGQRRVPKLTGKGAWTSGQILAEYSTLVAPYSPDYIFYIIGANDIGQGVSVDAFCNNLVSFIGLSRTAKPNCEIILISTPPTSSYDRATAKRYIKGMRKVAVDNGCSLVDLYSQLEQIDPSFYRYDNIHFNRQGDTIVFNILKNLVFPDVPLDYRKFIPVREALIGIGGNFYKAPVAKVRLTALIQCAATPVVLEYLGTPSPGSFAALTMAYSGSGTASVLNITPPAGWVLDGIENLTIGSATAARVNIQSIAVGGVVTASAMTSTASVDIINSGLYALVNYRQI